jgi:hypothetical protein
LIASNTAIGVFFLGAVDDMIVVAAGWQLLRMGDDDDGVDALSMYGVVVVRRWTVDGRPAVGCGLLELRSFTQIRQSMLREEILRVSSRTPTFPPFL